MLLAYARASKADDSQVLDLQRDALLFNEVDDTEPIPTLPEGPRSSVLDEIDGPHVLVNPAWAQAVALGRWPSQVPPSPPPALGGIPSLRSASERPPDNQVRSVITLMQHGRRSVVEFTLQLVQVALPQGRMIPEDFGEGRQITAIDLGLHCP
jgi:hypothetical protein